MAKLNKDKVGALAAQKGLVPSMQAHMPALGEMSADVFEVQNGAFAALVTMPETDLGWSDALDDEEEHTSELGTDERGYRHRYVMWGADNLMPVRIASAIGSDETVNSSLDALKKICYGSGVKFAATAEDDGAVPVELASVRDEVEDWFMDNDLPCLTLTQAKNYKMYAWNLDVVFLDRVGAKITDISARDVEEIRLAPRDKRGRIPYAYYGKFNYYQILSLQNVETITLLDERRPLRHLRELMGLDRCPKTGLYECVDPNSPASETNPPLCKCRKFGILHRLPTTEKRFYPIPSYAAILKGAWYDIKKLIETSLKAKLKNGGQIRYLVKIHPQFWINKLNESGIKGGLNSSEGKALVAKTKKEIIDYLTGCENDSKTWLTGMVLNTSDGKAEDMIKIDVIDNKTQGGDWKDDITEATNMLCYGMGIHPSLVGAVPGKSGNNNSGSDKREMYTIAQANEQSNRDIILHSYRLVLKYNGWFDLGIRASIPFMQLTTLDQHASAQEKNI